jgi:hypothetical protein
MTLWDLAEQGSNTSRSAKNLPKDKFFCGEESALMHFRQGLERICGLRAEYSMSQIPFCFSMSVDDLKSKKRREAVPVHSVRT